MVLIHVVHARDREAVVTGVGSFLRMPCHLAPSKNRSWCDRSCMGQRPLCRGPSREAGVPSCGTWSLDSLSPPHSCYLTPVAATEAALAPANMVAALARSSMGSQAGRDRALPAAAQGPRIFVGKLSKDTTEADVKVPHHALGLGHLCCIFVLFWG